MRKIVLDKCKLGSAIKEKRHRLKLTQKALSKATELSRTYIADVEAGRYLPSLNSICKIEKVLEFDLNFLLPMTGIQVEESV